MDRDVIDNSNRRLDNLFEDLLTETFHEEARAAAAVTRLLNHFREEGIPASFDANKFTSYVSRISDLKMLSLLIQGMGLANHHDQIITNEIDRLFPNQNPAVNKLVHPLTPREANATN